MTDRKLHWKTERIVEEANDYVEKMCGNSCLDWMYYEAGVEAEDEVRCRYTTWDDEKERYIDFYDVDIDECFTKEDWDDIERYIYAQAENLIDFLQNVEREENAI